MKANVNPPKYMKQLSINVLLKTVTYGTMKNSYVLIFDLFGNWNNETTRNNMIKYLIDFKLLQIQAPGHVLHVCGHSSLRSESSLHSSKVVCLHFS